MFLVEKSLPVAMQQTGIVSTFFTGLYPVFSIGKCPVCMGRRRRHQCSQLGRCAGL
jgi:hypothetical protein